MRVDAADPPAMSSSRLQATAFAVLLGLVAAGCAVEDISREDAIAALTTTGISEVEAICVADSLIVLGELDAVDPGTVRGEPERAALVTATSRCVLAEPSIEVAGTQLVDESTAFSAPRARDNLTEEELGAQDEVVALGGPEAVREKAISTLVLFGRSVRNATCVVDRIVSSEATHVLIEPEFGSGLDPFEADAFAACIGVD